MTRASFVFVVSLSLLLLGSLPNTASAVDFDGDGHDSIATGGDDCDDNDANRYPGNAEVCDSANKDEDCNIATFGTLDQDGDGFVSAQCCNNGSGGPYCGDDCDDSLRAINPNGTEVCNNRDDNCDGAVDWSPESGYVNMLIYLDRDRDGWGDSDDDSGTRRCPSYLLSSKRSGIQGDCDDSSASINPRATEACNGVDDNCNGLVDDGLTGACN